MGRGDRAAFLSLLIGEPWAWAQHNCWQFAAAVQRELFGREPPHVGVPTGFSRRWVIEEFAGHAARAAAPDCASQACAEIAAKDDQDCRSYGAQPGTDAYVQCRATRASAHETADAVQAAAPPPSSPPPIPEASYPSRPPVHCVTTGRFTNCM
ncbi:MULTISPECIES: hypothetical protein [unclassified Bradyrhizobium]|uniref:hypothetical protein n=1 Tax=Bradyrhizobium TaxID=374 RepID=UPI0028ECE401|nr:MULTISPECIES: hypothetical protein [unclassified Bradyrhizobium]